MGRRELDFGRVFGAGVDLDARRLADLRDDLGDLMTTVSPLPSAQTENRAGSFALRKAEKVKSKLRGRGSVPQ
jgi:hypothetical protein